MRHTITQGSLYGTLDIQLKEDEEILADPNSLVAMTAGIELMLSGKPNLAANWWGTFGAGAVLGLSVPACIFRALQGGGSVSLAPRFPGTVSNLIVEKGATLYLVGTHFLAASKDIVLSPRFVGNQLTSLRRHVPLVAVTGSGDLFYSGWGELIHRELLEDESIVVATRCLVGFEDSVEAEWELPPKDRAGGFLNPVSTIRLNGPGQVIYQTRSGQT